MRNKATLIILLLIIPFGLYADFWDNPSSSLYNDLYTRTVVPVIIWNLNPLILILTLLRRRIPYFLFWFVIFLNVSLALVSLIPVIDVVQHYRGNKFNAYRWTLFVYVIIPLMISTLSIFIRHLTQKNTDRPNR
jgi:hypothetical protein